MQPQKLIASLAGTEEKPYWVVDEQTAGDLIRYLVKRHAMCTGDYDRIAKYFTGGSLYDICQRLWVFCKQNFIYQMEDGETQMNSRPITMLKSRKVDCKNYALFIGGVLDALKRQGMDFQWCYRFVSYYLTDPDKHHVFVVVNRNTDDIWIDPVMDLFNSKTPLYWYKRDVQPKSQGQPATVGYISRPRIGSAQAEQQLLDALKNYTEGVVQAAQVSAQTGNINTITAGILQGAATAVPAIKAGQVALKLIDAEVGNLFGQGSAAARAINDLSNFNFAGVFNDLFNGRTYNTDQYWGAALFQNKVQGKGNINNQNQVVDGDVLPALKWFIDRTGVFISGREHIIALTQSPAAYLALASVNRYTTTDPSRVQAAYQVASRYWTNPTSYSASQAGSWANTVGVYDTGLAKIAASYGETAEQLAAQTNYQSIQQQISPVGAGGSASDIIPGVSNKWLYGALGVMIAYGLLS